MSIGTITNGASQRVIGASCQTATRKTASEASANTTTCARGEQPGGQLAARGARVARVDRRVDQAVDGHRERARADHRDRDPDHVARVPASRPRRGSRRRRRTGSAKTVCSIFTRITKRRAASRSRSSARLVRMLGRLGAQQLDRVLEHRREHGRALVAGLRAAGEVDHERAPADARDAAREHPVRESRSASARSASSTPGLSRSSTCSVRLRRDVARRKPRPAGREHESATSSSQSRAKLAGDLARSSRRTPRHTTSCPRGDRALGEHLAGAVLARVREHAVGDREDRDPHAGRSQSPLLPPYFSSSTIDSI